MSRPASRHDPPLGGPPLGHRLVDMNSMRSNPSAKPNPRRSFLTLPTDPTMSAD